MVDDKSTFFFDKLEKKFVFKISRTFFWILTSLTILAIIISALLLIYSFVPAVKEEVVLQTLPSEPNISYEDVMNEINYQLSSDKVIDQKQTSNKKKSNSTIRDISLEKKKNEVNILLDSLGMLFPTTWEGIYKKYPVRIDFWGRATEYRKELVKKGPKNRIESFFKGLSEDSTKIHILKNMINVIPNFDLDQREKALDIYLDLFIRKKHAHINNVSKIEYENNERLLKAEKKYMVDKNEKEELEDNALKGLIGGIVLIAFLGLIFSLLAIERNTRILRELIERDRDD